MQGKPVASDDLEYSIRLGGRLHADINHFEGVFNNTSGGDTDTDTNTESFIRRARLNINGYATSDWQYRVQGVLENNADSDISEAFIVYKGFGPKYWIQLGKQKEQRGLEWVTNSNMMTAIERSMATQAFSNVRSEGISLLGRREDISYQLGLFNNEGSNEDSKEKDPVVTGRLVKKLVSDKREVFQFGGSFSWRDGDREIISARPELRKINLADRLSSGRFSSSDARIINLEALLIKENMHFSGEIYQTLHRSEDYQASGAYLLFGYMLTGEKRLYDDLLGRFGGITPLADSGAWEVFSRLSYIDLADNGQGNKGTVVTLGSNWYLDANLRLMLNYIHAEYDKAPDAGSATGTALLGETSGDALAFRFQYGF